MSQLYLGGTDLSSATLKLGSTDVNKAYLGSTEVYSPGLPPVGSYVTSNLGYYFDFGDTNSYPGTGTDVTNLAPASTKYGDAQIWSGTVTNGSKTLTNSTFDAATGTLQLGGSGGTWNQYSADQSWFGDLSGYPTGNWPSNFTMEVGYYFQPQGWTGQSEAYFFWGQRASGPGQWGGLNQFTIGQVADYTLSPTLSPSTGTAQIVHHVISGTSVKRYVNGVNNSTVGISSTRRNASSIFAWGLLYTDEGTDRMSSPTWSKYQYVRFYWDKALTSTEVTQNYNANKARLGLT
jgi:hypothetical protein